jgi:hypothetical protein
LEKRKERWDVEEAKGITGKLFLCSGGSLFATPTRNAPAGGTPLTCRASAGGAPSFDFPWVFLAAIYLTLRTWHFFSENWSIGLNLAGNRQGFKYLVSEMFIVLLNVFYNVIDRSQSNTKDWPLVD